MKKEKVYISGAIAHHDIEERRRAFEDAARFLDLKGYEPVNPFDNGVAEDADWREGAEQGRKAGARRRQLVWNICNVRTAI